MRVTLVVRGHRFTGLTPEGKKVLRWARQILADYENLREDLSGSRLGLEGALRLGVIPAAMPSVSFLSDRFAKAHPKAHIEVHSMTSRMIQRGLDAFELDGGLTYLENEPLANVRRLALYREHYVFATNRTSRHAGCTSITWAEAARERLCLLSEDMQNRRIIDNVAKSIGAPISAGVVSNSFLGVCSHLRHGGWASIVPHTFFYMFGQLPDLIAIDLVEPAHSQAIGTRAVRPRAVLSDGERSLDRHARPRSRARPRGRGYRDLINIPYQSFQDFHLIQDARGAKPVRVRCGRPTTEVALDRMGKRQERGEQDEQGEQEPIASM